LESRPLWKSIELYSSIDASKNRDELGWEPKEDFESGSGKTNWYLDNHLWWKISSPAITGSSDWEFCFAKDVFKFKMNTVALFSDKHMLPGLHVTLLSLLRALSPEWAPKTKVMLYLDGVPRSEQDLLRRTHQFCHKGSLLEIIDYNQNS